MRARPGRSAAVAGGLLLLLAAAGTVAAQSAAGGLIKPGEPPDLQILYTGDVIGYIDPCG